MALFVLNVYDFCEANNLILKLLTTTFLKLKLACKEIKLQLKLACRIRKLHTNRIASTRADTSYIGYSTSVINSFLSGLLVESPIIEIRYSFFHGPFNNLINCPINLLGGVSAGQRDLACK